MHATHGAASVANVGRDLHIHQAAVTGAAAVVTAITDSTRDTREPFVGRDEQVKQLLNLLAPARRWPGPIVVSGMGGLGKTALARHTSATADDRGWFSGGVLFVNMRGYDLDDQHVRPERVFASMLRILAPDAQVPLTVDEQAAAYHQVLDRLATQERRVLLVLDNAATSTQVNNLLPQSGPHRALITSRETLSLPAAHQFPLDVLPAEEALQLLTSNLNRRCHGDRRAELEPDAAEQLAVTVCGALPLAVGITAAVLANEPDLSITDLIAELTEADGTGVHLLPDGERTVATVIDQSWHHLRARDPYAAQLLPLLTINPGPDFHTDAAAALVGRPPTTAVTWLRTLRHASLLRRNDNGRWMMHDLIRSHARDHLRADLPGLEAATQRLLDHYDHHTSAADDHLRALPGSPAPERFSGRAEALAWLDAERANLSAAVALALTTDQFNLTTRLAFSLSTYLSWQYHLDDWLATSEYACIAAQKIGGPKILSDSWNNFGLALRSVRRFEEAISAHEKARDICHQVGDRYGEGRAWNNLGLALREGRHFDEAVVAHEKARDICQQIGDRYGEGRAWNNLGIALRSVRRFHEAIAAYQIARDIYQQHGNRRSEGMAWNNLGLALRSVRRFHEAAAAHEKARDIFQQLGDLHGEGQAWNNLGSAQQELQRSHDAINAHQNARHICQQLGDHYGEGQAWNNLGLALRKVRRFHEAAAAHEKARDIFQQLGDLHGEGQAW
ncbi:tetratricopeptide repeat protein, partial [Amycolatopsis japonica]|uniref:tetratricopeptide repeat protein n=1 Tax=Amycolatopsis japonica TaxID=208439 RepID=UPI003670B39E